jgi:iron complex outermembrane recepter protein
VVIPITNMLEATLAARHDRYSDFGSTTNPKVALRFQPFASFLARASYSTGFRAPSLYELYQPNFLTFTAGQYDDPVLCPGGVPTPSADVGRDCNQQFLQQGGGNRKLQPEKAKNLTVGFVFEPIESLTIGIDLWAIRLENSIAGFPEQAIFGDPVTYQSRFVRAADGSLDYIVATNDNLGEIRTDGIDLSVAYRLRAMGGNLTLQANGTYLNKYEYQREIGGTFIQNVGRFSDAGVIFRWKHSLSATYAAPNWSVGVANRYQSGYDDENFVDTQFINRVKAYNVFDIYGSFSPVKGLTIAGGVRNLLDEDPPYSNQTQTFQAGYDPRYTDPAGRSFYLRLNYQFK